MIYIIIYHSDIYKLLVIKFTPLPKEYENVKNLDELNTNPKYTITSFSSVYSKYPRVVNDSTFYISTTHKQEQTYVTNKKFYKISRNTGNITDSLVISNDNTYEHHHYLVNIKKDYYTTWLIDGDTSKKSFNLIGNGKIHSKKEFKEYTDQALHSDRFYIEDSISKKRYVKTIYLKENCWNEIYTADNFYHHVDEYCCINYKLPTKPIEKMTTLNYFNKTAWSVDIFPDFNLSVAGGNGTRPDHWRGTAYYTLNTYNDISFKREGAIMYEDDNDIGDNRGLIYEFYENPFKKFLLISQMTGTDGSKHYLIQKK